MAFIHYQQLNNSDCGPTCLRMVSKFYGKYYSTETLRFLINTAKDGVSMLGISRTAEKIGFRTRGCQIPFDLLMEVPLPAILHWNQNHFVVIYDITKSKIKIADPAKGLITLSRQDFEKKWISNVDEDGKPIGTALLLEPSPLFYETTGEQQNRLDWFIFIQYFKQNKSQIFRIFWGLLISFLIQLIFPFLAQSMVDNGIYAKNLNFIVIILIAQLTLTATNTIVSFISSRIQIRISNIINISILSDFWIKLTRLPISYFETHRVGDIFQRLGDNRTIQAFITGVAMNTIFSIVNLLVYSFILISYSPKLFLIFACGNLLYFCWIRAFLPIRRKMNYQQFYLSAQENNSTIQMVQGMQEMRLNNAEQVKRWEWENIQAQVFKLNFKSLNYGQWQSAGALLINQSKDLIITFVVAKLVVDGQLTFGTMIAVQYIIGQLGGPISHAVGLIQGFQDAKISLERLNEIHNTADEEPVESIFESKLNEKMDIEIKNLNFTYPGQSVNVLKNINLVVPENKVTAIVGMSGSGKTTLLKILMKIFTAYEGEIVIGGKRFNLISPSFWRSQFGAVMQEGFIFNDTILNNIIIGDELLDEKRLHRSTVSANIDSYIDNLPNSWRTKIGSDGIGMSQGQKQRLLIARALYKDPKFLFFDEATNALDANNEKEIIENLYKIFKDKTVIVIAHRLSTVKNADNIVVMKNGEIVEQGTHAGLISQKKEYYELVKNQLELGD
ncbi:peptidase domain-containing ABC transporter [Pedobacter borealis]|uniref:peptidase domain-containing ABC transporter n=1 Tax=Pedobacter borealis TaxID=475254 RepID=UPI000493B40A|nr:peptidase domain-containing ABC transporter [Pedobacter borealis]